LEALLTGFLGYDVTADLMLTDDVICALAVVKKMLTQHA